ncbi:MAG: hypothetical protein FJ137_13850 [Deltaproteobacteria bacterium]|nr:hypothetical protein [Deltaproteobacteria bacterium]
MPPLRGPPPTSLPPRPVRRRLTWRHVVVVVLALLLGVGAGLGLAWLAPPGGFDRAARARVELATDTARGLAQAADIAVDDPDLVAVGALARLLLWVDHGADAATRIGAERALQAASPAQRTSPEGLYARALLATAPKAAAVDATLEADLAQATASRDPWVALARALRADVAERRRALEVAAFEGATPLPHATHALARWLLATDDLAGAQAALDRLLRQAPEHARGLVTAVVVDARADALASARGAEGGTRRPGPARRRVREQQARALLDAGLDPRDEDTLVFGVLYAALARGTGVEPDLLQRARVAATRSAEQAERALELALLDGDLAAADALVAALPFLPTHRGLRVDVARLRFARAVPGPALAAAVRAGTLGDPPGQGGRGVDVDGLHLPLGRLAFPSPTAPTGWFGLPWTAWPDPAFFPERRLAGLLDGVLDDRALESRLAVVDVLALAERALAAGEGVTARGFVDDACRRAPADLEVALLDAAVRVREGDRPGGRRTLAPLLADNAAPGLLLSVARLSIELDNLAGARRALTAFRRSGLRSSTAAALSSLLEVRGGDLGAARTALLEAQQLGGGEDTLALRAAIHVGRGGLVADARAAADALVRKGEASGGGDVVGAWVAEARYRAGEQPRAEAALRAILAAQPLLAEAHLFLARVIAFNPRHRAEALERALRAVELLNAGPLLDEAQALAQALKRR